LANIVGLKLEGEIAYFDLENFYKIVVYLDFLRDPIMIQNGWQENE